MQDLRPDESRTKCGSPAGPSPLRLLARTASAVGSCVRWMWRCDIMLCHPTRACARVVTNAQEMSTQVCTQYAGHSMAAWCQMPCTHLVGTVPGCLRSECTSVPGRPVWLVRGCGYGASGYPHATTRATLPRTGYDDRFRSRCSDAHVPGCEQPVTLLFFGAVMDAWPRRSSKWMPRRFLQSGIAGRMQRRRTRVVFGFGVDLDTARSVPRNGLSSKRSRTAWGLCRSCFMVIAILHFPLRFSAKSPRAPARCGAALSARAGVRAWPPAVFRPARASSPAAPRRRGFGSDARRRISTRRCDVRCASSGGAEQAHLRSPHASGAGRWCTACSSPTTYRWDGTRLGKRAEWRKCGGWRVWRASSQSSSQPYSCLFL